MAPLRPGFTSRDREGADGRCNGTTACSRARLVWEKSGDIAGVPLGTPSAPTCGSSVPAFFRGPLRAWFVWSVREKIRGHCEVQCPRVFSQSLTGAVRVECPGGFAGSGRSEEHTSEFQ